MVEEFKIYEWELRMRAVKRGIITAIGHAPEFTCVYVSKDIASEMQESTNLKGGVGDDTTFETVPLKVNHDLPTQSVIYIWNEEK